MLNLIMKEMKDFYSYKNKVFLLRTADAREEICRGFKFAQRCFLG